LASVELNGIKWTDGAITEYYLFNGWAVRINDKLPVHEVTIDEETGYAGTNILETPLEDGDVVHFFYEFPSSFYNGGGSAAANYVRAVYDDFGGNTLTVQLQGHKAPMQPIPPYIMSVNNYVNLGAGMIASLYDENGVLVQGGQPSDAYGVVTFTSNALIAGATYIVKTVPSYYYDDNWDWIDTAFFAQTGAYSKVNIPQ
jgi:hypothetical protein